MAEVVPFRGVLYNISKLSGEIAGEDLVAPPYDIITPDYQEDLYQRSPYNIVRVDYGKEFSSDSGIQNKYTRAKGYLDTWLKEQVLIVSSERCFYSYEVSYTIDNKEKRLRGVLGLVGLEELGKGNIHPHECTHSKPKKDRLEIMRVCNANISPIFSLFSSGARTIPEILASVSVDTPYIEAKDPDGAVHRLWKISDARAIHSITEELRDKAIFIADGHHRYETAIEFQKEMRAKEGVAGGPKPYDYVMMFLANMSDENLTILPTHRLVRNMPENALDLFSEFFEIEKQSGHFKIASALSGRKHVLGFYKGEPDEWYILKHKGVDLSDIPPALSSLDVSVLHELVFGRILGTSDIAYEMDVQKCLSLVRKQQFDAAFFLNPTQVEEVESVAMASLRMPPKSTYFYPKLMTGLVLNCFNNTF